MNHLGDNYVDKHRISPQMDADKHGFKRMLFVRKKRKGREMRSCVVVTRSDG